MRSLSEPDPLVIGRQQRHGLGVAGLVEQHVAQGLGGRRLPVVTGQQELRARHPQLAAPGRLHQQGQGLGHQAVDALAVAELRRSGPAAAARSPRRPGCAPAAARAAGRPAAGCRPGRPARSARARATAPAPDPARRPPGPGWRAAPSKSPVAFLRCTSSSRAQATSPLCSGCCPPSSASRSSRASTRSSWPSATARSTASRTSATVTDGAGRPAVQVVEQHPLVARGPGHPLVERQDGRRARSGAGPRRRRSPWPAPPAGSSPSAGGQVGDPRLARSRPGQLQGRRPVQGVGGLLRGGGLGRLLLEQPGRSAPHSARSPRLSASRPSALQTSVDRDPVSSARR